jgi:hypothetical protein
VTILSDAIRNKAEFLKFKGLIDSHKAPNCYIIECSDSYLADNFIKNMAMAILCHTNMCGNCRICKAIEEDNYIDFIRYPKNNRLQISLKDDINDFQNIYAMKSYEGGNRVFSFNASETYRDDWQNKLLKVLEEIDINNYIIIYTKNSLGLLPTIRSRCNIISVAPYSIDELKNNSNFISENNAYKIISLADGDFSDMVLYNSDSLALEAAEFAIEFFNKCNNSKESLKYISFIEKNKDYRNIIFKSMIRCMHNVMTISANNNIEEIYRKNDILNISENYSIIACSKIIEIINEAKKWQMET